MGRDLFGIKFGAHLAAHLTPEWRSQYLQYDAMVAILYAAVDRAPLDSEIARNRYFLRINERFFAYCHKELLKINVFFGEKLSESIRRFENLRTELNYFNKPLLINESEQSLLRQRRRRYEKIVRSNYRHIDDLKLAFSELYLLLVLLQNYQTLNHMGFKKILTKHDKLFHQINGIEWLKTNVDTSPFVSYQQVSSLIDEVEILVTDHLENGNRRKIFVFSIVLFLRIFFCSYKGKNEKFLVHFSPIIGLFWFVL
jgi:SPX domain protein involved in polyphosphate accumulation